MIIHPDPATEESDVLLPCVRPFAEALCAKIDFLAGRFASHFSGMLLIFRATDQPKVSPKERQGMTTGVSGAGLRLITIFLFCAAVCHAQAQESGRCNAILAEALLKKSVRQNDTAFKQAQRYFLCSSDAGEVSNYVQQSNTESGGGGGDFELFGIFKGGGKGEGASGDSSKEASLQKWKKSNCNETDSKINQSAAAYSLDQSVEKEVIAAWKACILNTGLTKLECLATPSQSEIQFEVYWKSNEGNTPPIDELYVSRNGTKEIIKTGANLLLGTNTFLVQRRKYVDHRFVFKAHSGAQAIECVRLVPGEIEPPLTATNFSPLSGKWCTSKRIYDIAEGTKEINLQDAGGRLGISYHPANYVPPGYPGAGQPNYDNPIKTEHWDSFYTVKPGVILRLERPNGSDNRYVDYEEGTFKPILLPTNGFYLWPVWIWSKKDGNLHLWRGLVKSKAVDRVEPQPVWSGVTEQIMQKEPTVIYRPC